jgi:hypothetical protein
VSKAGFRPQSGRSVYLRSLVVVFALSLAAAAQPVPLAQHVVLVIEENTSYKTVVGPPAGMPWLVSQGNQNTYANNFYSNVGGSLLDYLWLASGSSELAFGCNGNSCASPITDDNIFRLLNDQPITWKVYAQSYLNAGGTVTTPDAARGTHYYRRHNAVVWYSDILSNTSGSKGGLADFEQFLLDVQNRTLPRFSILVPDGSYDGHDGSPASADSFLQNNLGALLSLPDFQSGGSGLLIVTFDNGDGDAQGQVYTTFIGPNVKKGSVSHTYYQHQNTFRTVLDSLGLGIYPGAAGAAADMTDFFVGNAGSVVLNSPASASAQGTSVLVNAEASEMASAVDHMEVWDNGKKLANVFASNVNQTFTLSPGAHEMTVQDVGTGPNDPVIHKRVVDFSVLANNGVYVVSPVNYSTQASLFPVTAYAVEASGNMDRLEVWADGRKLGDSPHGASIDQWFNGLAPGQHQIIVQSVTANDQILHKQSITITVAGGNSVYVNSPANESVQHGPVLVNAYAYEQNNSTQQVARLEVWDNGVKLGDSPLGWNTTSLFIRQAYTLTAGSHQMTIQDIGTGANNPVLHKSSVNFTVQ